MLSYMLPVEDKSPPHNLNLNLDLDKTAVTIVTGGSTKSSQHATGSKLDSSPSSSAQIINFERQHHYSTNRSGAVKSPPIIHKSEAQRPKSLVKPNNNNQQQQHQHKQHIHFINMDANSADNAGMTGISGGNGGSSSHSILATSSSVGGSSDDGKKTKMSKIGNNKNVALKRVSFGSSKGSMVETLVFETPTPLPEHAEREFGFPPADTTTHANVYGAAGKSSTTQPTAAVCNNSSSASGLDDSGIEMQEELERSKVRVTFFQSGKPQQISPPDHPQHLDYFNIDPDNILIDNTYFVSDPSNLTDESRMAASQTALPPNYNRQISTESGWDNPFRPGGDLSREADEIVNMIKGGKPITPNDVTDSLSNGLATENGAVVETVTKTEASQNQQSPTAAGNGKSGAAESDRKNGSATQQPSNTQISNSVIPGPQSASHVVVDDKKKKKCTCCVIQ